MWGSGFRDLELVGFRAQGFRTCRLQGFRTCRVQGSGLKVLTVSGLGSSPVGRSPRVENSRSRGTGDYTVLQA